MVSLETALSCLHLPLDIDVYQLATEDPECLPDSVIEACLTRALDLKIDVRGMELWRRSPPKWLAFFEILTAD